jgi:class 3 adenylate cyclase
MASGPSMGFDAGWDALDRADLRFRNPNLERSYRSELLETRRRRQRMSMVSGALIFLALAAVAPALLELPVWPMSALLLVLVGTNLLAALLVVRARTTSQLDAIGIGIQLSTGLLLLAVTVAIDSFTRYAAPALLAIAMFAIGMSRHPFRNAVVISTGQALAYLAFGFAQGLAPGVLVDVLILGTALAGACVGTYVAERGDRRLFAQGLVVDDLHRRVNDLFHRYLAPEVADALIAEPRLAELGGEEVEVTVLFADLTGFTTFSERVRPDEAVAMLNTAFAAAVPVILREGGTLIQFSGDALMAIFNAPVRQADHALRAARAALALQVETAAVRGDANTPQFRVGLNSGPALVGNVGSAELRTFTAIGDTTNLAARLQTFAPAGSVVVGQRTAGLLGDLAELRPLGTPDLKGKSVPVNVYELLAIRDPRPAAVR